jgi:CHASE3 domain sensor protein
MVEEQSNYTDQYFGEVTLKLRDLEEKQKILKDRLFLIGENLVELKDKLNNENLEIKKNMTIMQDQLKKMLSFLETASSEMSKFAKKEDLEILYKQARMFQPFQ